MDTYTFKFSDLDSLVIAVRDIRKMYTHLFICSFPDTLTMLIKINEYYSIHNTTILQLVEMAGGTSVD